MTRDCFFLRFFEVRILHLMKLSNPIRTKPTVVKNSVSLLSKKVTMRLVLPLSASSSQSPRATIFLRDSGFPSISLILLKGLNIGNRLWLRVKAFATCTTRMLANLQNSSASPLFKSSEINITDDFVIRLATSFVTTMCTLLRSDPCYFTETKELVKENVNPDYCGGLARFPIAPFPLTTLKSLSTHQHYHLVPLPLLLLMPIPR
jgi:hypothetical protein